MTQSQVNAYEVHTPAGAVFSVLGPEKAYYESLAQRYLQESKFTQVTDLQDLDRVLALETLSWRWSQWISMEEDYWGNTPDLDVLKKSLRDYSQELRLLKKSIGLDKATRDKAASEGVAEYIENLRLRAKAFGYHRNLQARSSVTLFMDLKALITVNEKSDEREKKELHVEDKDVLEWIRKVAIPEFDKLDEDFRKEQKLWIRDQ